MNIVLIKMGGKGVRFGASVPKQFYEINGEPLFAYVLRKYSQIQDVHKYIIVTNSQWKDITKQYASQILGDKLIGIVDGAETNTKSARQGIEYASAFLKEDDVLLIHDITDPIINFRAITEAICAAKKYGCATVITEQVHTLYSKNEEGFITGTIKKSDVGSGYSPEAFLYKIVRSAFESATEDELDMMTSAMEVVQKIGKNRPYAVISHQLDLKITYKEDMQALSMLITQGEFLYGQ